MAAWDKIYRNYLKGGPAYATLSGEILPLFKKFLNQSVFETKRVLDLGCGEGKYLKFLKSFGFKTEGIDSSKTAVKMAKKSLNDNSKILFKNMFRFVIPKNKYDLIISISTIHHGTKKQVRGLVDQIHRALIRKGKIFITLPDCRCIKIWNTFKNHREISPGTFMPTSGPEKGLPHSFYTKEEVRKLFSKFKRLKIKMDDENRWIIQAQK